MKKLYAYSDDDGYIHFNVQGEKGKPAIWNRQTKSWLKREPQFESREAKVLWVYIALLIVNLIQLVVSLYLK